MAKTAFKSVEDYLLSQPEAAQRALERVRAAIRRAVPEAQEVISYQMPAYKLPGGVVLYVAGWKRHYSIYPAKDQVVAAFKDELARYEVEKGTIRFPLDEPVPVKLIGAIAKFRAKQVAESETGKSGKVR